MTRMFDGKVAVVTGGNSGIGRATAIAFAREGAKVVVASRRSEANEETVRLIRDAGGEAAAITTDVSKAADVDAMVKRAVELYGRLDYAFNNAGVSGSPRPITDITEEEFDEVVATNLKGVWLCMKYEIPQMLSQGGGAIVNMSSLAGLLGLRAMSLYSASKHGVIGLTKSAAMELATSNVRVNAVCPATIRNTPMIEWLLQAQPEMGKAILASHPMGRGGQPEEVAGAVLWLCSDASSFVTGLALPIDGGTSAGKG